MQLGDPVNGLMMNHHWRFIVSDAHGVADAVHAYDGRCRLAGHDEDQRVAVARLIEREAFGGELHEDDVHKPLEGGVFMLVFYPRRRDGSQMIGEPDSSVLEQLRERDTWARLRGVNERELRNEMEKVNLIREAAAAERMAEKLRASTEERMFGWAQKAHVPWAPGRIWVPASAAVPPSPIERDDGGG